MTCAETPTRPRYQRHVPDAVHVPESLTLSRGEVWLQGDRWHGDHGHVPFVLLHGGGQTRHSWARTSARLAAYGHDTTTLDLRGHGDSAWAADGDYSLDAHVDDVSHLLATFDRAPILVGASLGGLIALLIGAQHPNLVTGLVLVDAVVSLEDAGVERVRDFMAKGSSGFASLEDVADAVSAYAPSPRRPRSPNGLRKNVRQGADGRWYWHWDPAVMASAHRLSAANRRRLLTAAQRVTVPVLLVRGAVSDVVSDAGMEEMLEAIPSAEAVVVETAGHMVVGDDNDVFATRLLAFAAAREADMAADGS